MRSYKSTDKMCRHFTCTASMTSHFHLIPPAWNTTAFVYTEYFIRGVNNTHPEFDAKAVIDKRCCKLDIPLDCAVCVICNLNGT